MSDTFFQGGRKNFQEGFAPPVYGPASACTSLNYKELIKIFLFGHLDLPRDTSVFQLLKQTCLFHGARRKFSWSGGSFSGIWWPFVFGVRCLWRHNLTSYSCFQTNVLAKCVDTICRFFSTHSPHFMCDCTEYKLSALQVRILEEHALNATTQQLLPAKRSGCALKQGSKKHPSPSKSNLQLQNQAALMSRWIRTVVHTCAAGLAGSHPGLQDRILLNHTRIENAHKVRKKTFVFLLCIEVQPTFSFLFSLLRHYQMPEWFYVTDYCFWARATVLSCYIN